MKNMRKLVYLFSLLSLWMAASVSAQSLKKQEATMEDYLPLLNATGYKVYTFDISEFKDDSYLIHFKVKEYTDSINGKEIGRPFTFPSRLMLDNFPKEQQERIISEGRAYDAEKGIYIQGNKLTIGFTPGKADSIKVIHCGVNDMGASSRQLNLKGLKLPNENKVFYSYESRPFVIDKFEEGKFIPLVFFASYWVDEKFGFFRFCGAMEISPTMGQEYIENSPHYYVIGVEINKQK